MPEGDEHGDRIPTGHIAAALLRLYERATVRLRLQIEQAVTGGHEWTAEFRGRQLQQAEQIIDRLQREARAIAPEAVDAAYSAGALATDEMLARVAQPVPEFGGVHVQSAEVLTRALVDRIDTIGLTVGRQVDDVFRTTALEVIAEAQVTGDPNAVAARRLAQQLSDQGVTAFVDKAGRQWKLDTYSRMAVRTGLRESVTVAQVNRFMERGVDLIRISDHDTETALCKVYEGRTFSIGGATPGYEVIDRFPPFHPNCEHVLTPAPSALDELEREFGVNAPQAS